MGDLNMSTLKPEIALLLNCINVDPDLNRQAQIQQIIKQSKIDWEKLLKLARFHRLLPLLYKSLSPFSSQAVPDHILQELRRLHLQTIQRNFRLVQELIAFLDILDAHSIKSITFKGPTIAQIAYGDLSLRMFSDLDLLVAPNDFLVLRDIAVKHGYQCDTIMAATERTYLAKLSKQQQFEYLKSQKEFSLYNPKSQFFLDIHQGILSKQFSHLFDVRWIWQHTQTINLGGRQVICLTPEISILISCAQGAEDLWCHLGKICDLAMLIKAQENLNWEYLLDRSNDLGMLPSFLLGLSLAQDLCGVILPDTIQQQLMNSTCTHTVAKAIQQSIFTQEHYSLQSKFEVSYTLHQLKLMPGWHQRLRFCLTLLEPTLADLATIELPSNLFFLYYVLRILRLTQQVFDKTLASRLKN